MDWAALQAFQYGQHQLDGIYISTERKMEPLSDEWFKDLDQSIDEITRLFEELRVAPPEPEGITYIREAENDLDAVQDDLMNCLTTLEDAKQRLRQCNSPDRSDDDPYKSLRPRSLDLQHSPMLKQREPPATHRKSISVAGSSLGDAVMKQVFKWWQPYGPSCVRDFPRRCDRLGQKRSTEVDGRLIH